MNQYPVDLFDFCNSEMKDALVSFCNRVNHSKADVYIIMAHKAVILFRILQQQGHIDKRLENCVVVTNFSLDFDCTYLKGKKIAILDDIVISGTSISSTVNKLLSLGVAQDDIEVIAVAIDHKYLRMSFENSKGVNSLYCDCKLDDAPCIELSAIISKVFSYYGVPYDVDFPVYEGISINAEHISKLCSNMFWNVVDVTNENQKSGGVTAYTLYPTQSIRSRLWSSINAELESCTDVKIRLYITQYPNGSRNCSIVPMCLFKEISVDTLKMLHHHLTQADQTRHLNDNKSHLAQIRYLEFYIAHQLFLIFSEFTAVGRGRMFHKNIAMQLFGLNDGEIIFNHLSTPCSITDHAPIVHISHAMVDNSSIIEEYKKSSVYKANCAECRNWTLSSAYQQGCWINQFIFNPFMWWYDEKEIKVRNILKCTTFHYVKDYDKINNLLFRLQNGLPMSVLHLLLKHQVSNISDNEANLAISTFIDRAIDEGIIVPSVYYNQDKQYLCRVYRHGEDLPFGIADQYRLVYFLQALGGEMRSAEIDTMSSGFPEISEISFEKMIVLFYQMGLRQGNIFNRFLGFNNIDIIHSFLSLHGAIQGYTDPKADPHFFSERDNTGSRYITWLTTWLCEKGLIHKRYDSMNQQKWSYIIRLDVIEQYLMDYQRSTVSPMVQEKIESLAELIATWYNAMARASKKVEFRNQITALTSCANRFVYASAIATEIHYFSRFWEKQAQHALQEDFSSQFLIARLTDSEDNRKYTSDITKGLFSGRQKVQWRNENKAQAIITDVKKFLGSTSTSVWSQLWSGIDTQPDIGADDLEDYTNTAVGFLFFYSACFECLRSKGFWDNGILPKDYVDYKNIYLKLASRTDSLDPTLFSTLDTIAEMPGSNPPPKKCAFNALVNTALFSSKTCVERIETIIRGTSPTYTVAYTSALVLDIFPLDPSQVNDAFMRFWEQLPEDEAKTELNIIRFPQNEGTDSCVKYGVFYGASKRNLLDVQARHMQNVAVTHGKFLLEAFEKICSLLNGRLFKIRGILLPHIPPGSNFKHNLQRNINKNATDFHLNLIAPLESCYSSKYLKQLILGLDHHVDSHFLEYFNTYRVETVPHVLGAEWVTTCKVCSREQAVPSCSRDQLMDKVAYSQLKVSCTSKAGLGFLMRVNDRVLCVTCNHICEGHPPVTQAHAESVNNPNIQFALHPLSKIHQYQPHLDTLWAQNEVLVLEPCWHGDIPFDISMLISMEDWSEAHVNTRCKCYGCNDDFQMCWTSCGYVGGAIGRNYYQIDGVQKEVLEGCSGAIYMQTDTMHKTSLIGIHEGRFDREEKVRMIPWAAINTAIQNIGRSNTDE